MQVLLVLRRGSACQFTEVIILRVIWFCAIIQLSPSDPITELAYCRGDFFCHPDNLALTPFEPTLKFRWLAEYKSFGKNGIFEIDKLSISTKLSG
jgi:hypothetical protein